ncbi:MAG: Phosphohistidine phosphatase SixA [Chlamydiia bacterium]|nr:Phosphohistidine phosphatase SixA [Chlamydiia bacterium]
MCPISPEGRLIQEKMSKQLKEQGILPHQILYSPTKRTRETAEILGTILNIKTEEEKTLAIDEDGRELIKKIPMPALNQTIFMVGHAPSLMRFASQLLGGKVPIREFMNTSSALVLAFDDEIAFGKAHFVKYLSS